MTEIDRIADQLERALYGEAWHGPALAELLADLEAEAAATRRLPGAHSIWEIVLHVDACHGEVARRLAGEEVDLADADAWPPVTDTSERAWRAARGALRESHQKLLESVRGLPPERLDEGAPGSRWDLYQTLHGLVQHDLYHAGQIALLKKAGSAKER
jgi:uncharacterized damage-inducible protein DinB